MAAAAVLRNRSNSHSHLSLLTRFLDSPSFFLRHRRWMETVAYEEVLAHPDKPYTSTAVIIHGFLGSARNWRSFSRNLLPTLSNSSPFSSTSLYNSPTLFFFGVFSLYANCELINLSIFLGRLEDGDVGYEESWEFDGEETESAS